MIGTSPPEYLYTRELPSRNSPSLYGPKSKHDTLELRIKSYVYAPKHIRKFKEKLANNGFSFVGKSSEIKCYICSKVTNVEDEMSLNDSSLQNLHFVKCRYSSKKSLDEVDGVEDHTNYLNSQNQPDTFFESHCEDEELDVEKYTKENEKLRNAWICRKCEKEKIQTLFLPCRHLIMCEACAESSDYCLHCFEKILGTVRTYKV